LGKLKEIGDEGAVFLYMGTATIPLGTRKRDVRHVLFMDSTFHLSLSSPIMKLSETLCRKYDKFEREAIAAADHIFTVSECAKADIVDHYAISAERVTAVGTGMGSIQPTEGKKDYSACTTLFVAKQRFEEKGGLLLLEGFRLAQKENPRLKLIVVATEPYRYMTEQVPGVTFKTALSWEALEAYFNEASLFAMPALYEPWGLVYVESLACRTPVLGMNRNALPELTQNGKYGFLLNDANPSSVAGALLEAFSNIEQLAEMGCGGQEYVQGRYTWDKVALRIVRALF
jgi:glycosyltransferase involved in cell wall biosynthesis